MLDGKYCVCLCTEIDAPETAMLSKYVSLLSDVSALDSEARLATKRQLFVLMDFFGRGGSQIIRVESLSKSHGDTWTQCAAKFCLCESAENLAFLREWMRFYLFHYFEMPQSEQDELDLTREVELSHGQLKFLLSFFSAHLDCLL